jgi:hypothetical protein
MKRTEGGLAFMPALIQQYFDRYPDLRITADFSHWCNVSETFLQNQKEICSLLFKEQTIFMQGSAIRNPVR